MPDTTTIPLTCEERDLIGGIFEHRTRDAGGKLNPVVEEYVTYRQLFEEAMTEALLDNEERVRLLSRIDSLERELEGRWIPVEERLPEPDIRVDCAVMKSDYFPDARPSLLIAAYSSEWGDGGGWYYPARFYGDKMGTVMSNPTHWRPLSSVLPPTNKGTAS